MDNLGSHKAKAVRQFIRAAGAKLFFLPKYSPDLNPIEQVFAKIKHFLRKVAARSVETICCYSACKTACRITVPDGKGHQIRQDDQTQPLRRNRQSSVLLPGRFHTTKAQS